MRGICAGVCTDGCTQGGIVFVWISGNDVQILGKCCFHRFGKAQRVNVAAEIQNFRFGDAVFSFDGVQIAAMLMHQRFCFHDLS